MDSHFWLLTIVSISSVYGIALLSASIFTPTLLITLTIITCLMLSRFTGVRYSEVGYRWTGAFALTLVLAVFLRSDIYPHMMGGQDQGLYTNYAELMLKHGGLNFVDQFRNELPDSLKAIYDNVKMASVPMIDADKSLMTVAFYPLHPMWMAVFAWGLGVELKTLSLLLFSIIYIWTGKLLTEEIFRTERAGTIAAMLLALNPALVFYSKYPVTEMVGLAFSLSGFLYLIRGVKSVQTRKKLLYLSLSVLSFTSFFFVRMQFLMYLPFISLLILGLVLHDGRLHWRNGAIPSLILVCILFGFSLVWYFLFQKTLFDGMIGGHVLERISSVLTTRLIIWFLGGLLLAVILLLAVLRRNYALSAIPLWFVAKGGVWLVFAFILSVFSILSLYKTGNLQPFPWILDTNDPLLFRYHALYRLMILISPFALFVLVYGSLNKICNEVFSSLLLLFIATSWIVVLVQPYIPYLYYYGRYLAGEVLPYSLIAIAGIMSILINQKIKLAYTIIMLIGVYYFAFYVAQFRFIESESRDSFVELSNSIRKHDIVLAVGLDDRMLVPLRLTYGKKIFSLKQWDTSTHFVTSDLPQLRSLALEDSGRLLLITPAELSLRFGNYLGGVSFDNSFITNGEHIRQGVIQSSLYWEKMFLPFIHVSRTSNWILHDISSVDFNSLPHGGRCLDFIDFSSRGN